MRKDKNIVYPYIPNSVPGIRQEMLGAVGAESLDELYDSVPDELRLKRPLNLPRPCLSEYALKRHVTDLLAKNKTCEENISFLGAGCYQHHVPAVCDEINRRSEFLTAYAGEPYDDHGRFQALFETASMMGELLEMDMVNVPTYDGLQAAATAVRMAARLNGRTTVVVSRLIHPDKVSKMVDYCRPHLNVRVVGHEPGAGLLDLQALKEVLGEDVAAVYLDNPCFLGHIETRGQDIADLVHQCGAEFVVGVNPTSLGVLTPPAAYGADIVCGDLQPLGMHLSCGGGHAGFIASRDEERYVMEYPSRLFGIAPTRVEGEYGFGDVAFDRTSFAVREDGKEWVGTASALWGITAGVYLALMGPHGMAELGQGLMERARYAQTKLNGLSGVICPVYQAVPFQEFVVDFSRTGRSVADINDGLLERGFIGGLDVGPYFPELNQCALYCVSEVHAQADIDGLVQALNEVLQ